jgi:hypothetical protein
VSPVEVSQPRVFRAVDGSVAVQDLTTRGVQCDLYELVRVGPQLGALLERPFRYIPGEALHRDLAGAVWMELYPCSPVCPCR